MSGFAEGDCYAMSTGVAHNTAMVKVVAGNLSRDLNNLVATAQRSYFERQTIHTLHFQVLRKASTKKVITQSSSSKREEKFCMQSCSVLEPFTTCSSVSTGAASFQRTTGYLYLLLLLLLSLFSPRCGLFWTICPFPIIKYIYTFGVLVLSALDVL